MGPGCGNPGKVPITVLQSGSRRRRIPRSCRCRSPSAEYGGPAGVKVGGPGGHGIHSPLVVLAVAIQAEQLGESSYRW